MAMPLPEEIRPLRREEYDRLVALGAFANERIELLEGQLVQMSPIGPPHSSAVQKLVELLLPALLGRASVFVQSPFGALDSSEPEPDVAVVPFGDYHLEHPTELVAYAALGVAGGFAALAFTKIVVWLRPRLRRAPPHWRLLQPLAGT